MMAVRQASTISSISRTGSADMTVEPSTATLSVVLAGGEALYREGVKSLLTRHDVTVLGEVDNTGTLDAAPAATAGASIVLALTPDFANVPGPEWRQHLQALWPDARVLAMAHPGEEGVVAEAIRAGADGCVFTDTSAEGLIQSLRLVALGEGLFPTRVGELLIQAGGPCVRPRLTPREKDILRGLLSGYSNKMIANDLGTTDMTVKAQLRHLLRKLGVANRTQAALWAREQGIAPDLQN